MRRNGSLEGFKLSTKNVMKEKGAGKRQAGRNEMNLGKHRRYSAPIYAGGVAPLLR